MNLYVSFVNRIGHSKWTTPDCPLCIPPNSLLMIVSSQHFSVQWLTFPFSNLLNLIFKHLIVFEHLVLSTKHSTWAVSPTLYESLSKTARIEVDPLSKKNRFLTSPPTSMLIFYLGLMLGRDTIMLAFAIIG